MTGAHAGQDVPADVALADQLTGLQNEITEFMAARAATPLLTTPSAVLRDYADALITVYGILSRTQTLLMQIEART